MMYSFCPPTSTLRVIMPTDSLLKHIQRRLVTFLHFVQQRVLLPTVVRKLCIALFKRLALSLRFLRPRWPNFPEKQWKRFTIDEQIVIPLDNVACSRYPSGHELQEASSSKSSQILDAAIFSQSPEMLHRHISTPHIYVSEESYSAMDTTHLVSSPTADTHYPTHRGNSMESIEWLGPGEMSRSSCDITDVNPDRVPPNLSIEIDLSRRFSRQETLVPSPICFEEAPSGVYPVAPENFQRYANRRRIPKTATKVTMEPLLRDFLDHDDIPGWNTCTHPEGGRYFHHAQKRIFTDADLHNSTCRPKILEAINVIDDFTTQHSIQISEKADLVLDFFEDDDEEYIGYYFADHKSRTVVFLHEFDSDCIPHWGEIKGINSGTHLRHALEMQYWWHCLTYPNCIELTEDLVCELRSSVVHFIGDCMTSPYANSPYPLTKLENILSYTDSLKDNIGKPYSGSISFLSRIMYQMSSTKFFNFYGQPEARLNRDHSVFGVRTNPRTWFIKSISLFLFSAPDVHLRNLQKMWVDGIMHKAVWEESLTKMTDEWREFIINAAVLLNANVGFLAINSVDTNRDPYRSPAQISSYCSISASIGCIILGLILVRQNQTKQRETASDVQNFLQNRAHPWLGLETLAIMFSLPYALLMWGMVSFLMAFWFQCLQYSGAPTRSVVAIVSGVILILIVWCIWTAWERPPSSDAESPEDRLSFEKGTTQRRKGFKFERNLESQPQNPFWPTPFPLHKWMSGEKQPPFDVESPTDNLSVEGDCAEQKLDGESETSTRYHARRFRTSSLATSFKFSFKNSRRETGTTVVEGSVDDEKGKSSP